MNSKFLSLRNLLIFPAILALFIAPRASAQSASAQATPAVSAAPASRITQPIDETTLVTIRGNVHPLARAEFDQGAVEDSMPVTRAWLRLQRSDAQEAALLKLLDDQQNKNSGFYHAWLTPQQFGTQFGPVDSDIQALTGWLTAHGFHDIAVAPGRTIIEFSGNVGQIRSAFHTDIHKLTVHGQAHLANVNDPQVPGALAPVIAGIEGLHDFRPKSLVRRATGVHLENATVTGKLPSVTLTGGCGSTCYAVGPADFNAIYSVPSTVNGSPAGQGVPIAIVQDSNLSVSDVQQFRTLFGITPATNFTNTNVILNGPDPGVQDPNSLSGDETEADLDVEMAGAVAPAANIQLVVSENSQTLGVNGIDLSALYIINNNLAPIMSESFGNCETATNGAEAFYASMWEQAAAQGITVIVSAGDNGSDICDALDTSNDFATTGLSISALTSTPFNISMGGTDFQNGTAPSVYWTTAAPPAESAISYIPETTWNSSCAANATSATLNTSCTATIINNNTQNQSFADLEGGSGGESAVATNTKPAWQVGITPATDTRRDIPDISLFSAVNTNSNSFLVICEQDSQNGSACSLTTGNIHITALGGTSAAAPAFAGIMALVVQQQGGEPAGRQGNANHVLYQLYNKDKSNAALVCPSNTATATSVKNGTATCIFYDTITGNNSVACQAGTPNCSSPNVATAPYGVLVDPVSTTTPAYSTVAGYDKATGLGSVNVTNLLKAWSSASFTSDTVAITSSPSATLNHGTNANFTVKITPGSGGPATGNIVLLATPPSPAVPVGIGTDINGNPLTLSSGSVSFTTNELPGGTSYPVVAQYGGDGTFASGTSAPVDVTVNKENSQTIVSMWTFDSLGNLLSPNATTAAYGSPYILRIDVENSSSQQCSTLFIPCPTGQVSVTDNGVALNDFSSPNSTLPAGTTTLPNGIGFIEDQPVQLPGGTNALIAKYAGDSSYNSSTSATDTITITAGLTATSVAAAPASATTATPVTLTATIATQSSGAGPTGNVVFSANGTSLGSVPVVPTAASGLNTLNPIAAFSTATLSHTFATIGSYSITAAYTTADSNYSSSSSSGVGNATVTVTSQGSFSMTASAATVTTAAGSGTAGGNSTVTLTPTGGFSAPVAITCNAIPGVTCSPLTIPQGSTTGSLAINVANPSSAMTAMAAPQTQYLWAADRPVSPKIRSGLWTFSGGTGLAAVFLLLLPGRKRLRAAMGLGLMCVLSFALGCGGGYGGGGGGGATATTTQLTVSSTKVAKSGSITVSAAVTGKAPTGSVQFLVDGTTLGSAAPLTSGATGNITVTAAQAPAFLQLVGTHTVTAQYSGDTYNLASSSGALNVTITGVTQLGITASPAASNANVSVALTIN